MKNKYYQPFHDMETESVYGAAYKLINVKRHQEVLEKSAQLTHWLINKIDDTPNPYLGFDENSESDLYDMLVVLGDEQIKKIVVENIDVDEASELLVWWNEHREKLSDIPAENVEHEKNIKEAQRKKELWESAISILEEAINVFPIENIENIIDDLKKKGDIE